ncbi:PAM68 family protein [Prochlorococcus marinus]|uniref:PAM68 family protein n=1 Tax=Prochlorococcus marinus TaxID=1219 RepID=UPI0022B3D81E|nr:PAM68 family protein [Prochlorococcus marinus]
MKGEKRNKKNQPKEVKIGFSGNDSAPKIVKNKSLKTASKKSGIPSYVANRMARRIAFTTGIPTLSGMGVFIGSYFLISKGIAEISPTLTLVSSAICFLVGLLGLSYGILSASWDFTPGTFLGFENIKPNINRMKDAFKTSQKDIAG